jgi:hypothetical protein
MLSSVTSIRLFPLLLEGLGHLEVLRSSGLGVHELDLEPVGVACLGQEFLGLLRVVGVGRQAEVAGGERSDDVAGGEGTALIDVFHDGFPIHREVERLAHPLVVERLLGAVEPDVQNPQGLR